jgi:hypothetical protein
MIAILIAQPARNTSPSDGEALGAIMASGSHRDVAQSAEEESKPPCGAGGFGFPS